MLAARRLPLLAGRGLSIRAASTASAPASASASAAPRKNPYAKRITPGSTPKGGKYATGRWLQRGGWDYEFKDGKIIASLSPETNPAQLSTPGPTTSSSTTGNDPDPQLGGYPQLPSVPYDRRAPLGWWDKQDRRNFGETLHAEDDILSMQAPDSYAISGPSALRQLLLAAGIAGLVAFTIANTVPERPALPRDYPRDGLREELGGLEANKAPVYASLEDEE